MQVRLDPKAYAEHWEKESMLFERKGVYKCLAAITPPGSVIEIGSGIGLGTLALASARKVLALDSNAYLIEKAQSRLRAAAADVEIVCADLFQPSVETVRAIRAFSPRIMVGWFIGSNADDQEKYVASDVPHGDRPKKYRENVEDSILADSICPRSVEWVHLASRVGMIAGISDALARQETKADYDTHVFLPRGFEVVDVQILDWDMAGSSFKYVKADNPNLLPGQSMPKLVSVLARRQAG